MLGKCRCSRPQSGILWGCTQCRWCRPRTFSPALRPHKCSFRLVSWGYMFKFLVLLRPLKSAFCLSTSPKAPCWRFPILAMTMSEQARHCSFGLTKTFFFVPRKVRFLAMALSKRACHCSFGLSKTSFLLPVFLYTELIHIVSFVVDGYDYGQFLYT